MGKIVNIDGRTLNLQDDGTLTDTFSSIEELPGGKVKLTHAQNVGEILQHAYECRKAPKPFQNKSGDMRQIAVVPPFVFDLFPEINGDLKAFKKWLFKEKLEGRDWSVEPQGFKSRAVVVK